jgi:hypothetical protein
MERESAGFRSFVPGRWTALVLQSLTQGEESMNRFLYSVAAVGLCAGLSLGADLKSGPEPGQGVTPFNPLNVTGADAGSKRCLV